MSRLSVNPDAPWDFTASNTMAWVSSQWCFSVHRFNMDQQYWYLHLLLPEPRTIYQAFHSSLRPFSALQLFVWGARHIVRLRGLQEVSIYNGILVSGRYADRCTAPRF